MAKSKSFIWRGILSIVLGLVLVIWPSFTTKYIVTILGSVLLTVGIIMVIVRYTSRAGDNFPVVGVISAIVGILLIAMPQTFAAVLIVIMGVLLVLGSASQIYMLVRAKKSGFKTTFMHYIVPCLLLITGVVIAFSPQSSLNVIIIAFGVASIVYGASDLIEQGLLADY